MSKPKGCTCTIRGAKRGCIREKQEFFWVFVSPVYHLFYRKISKKFCRIFSGFSGFCASLVKHVDLKKFYGICGATVTVTGQPQDLTPPRPHAPHDRGMTAQSFCDYLVTGMGIAMVTDYLVTGMRIALVTDYLVTGMGIAMVKM